jgi:hypothetical protein
LKLASLALVCLALGLLSPAFGAEGGNVMKGAGPAEPPKEYRNPSPSIDGASVVEGQSAGIENGDYAPDFELEPVQPHADLARWLGDKAPESVEDKVMLSDLLGKAPVLLLFGSYT